MAVSSIPSASSADIRSSPTNETIAHIRSQLLLLTHFPVVVIDLIIEYSKSPKFHGIFLSSFGKGVEGKAEFNCPVSVVLWSDRESRKGEIKEYLIISDQNNHRLVVCDKKGSVIRMIGEGFGQGNGQLNVPRFLSVFNDNIFVSDPYNHRIQKFHARSGKFLRIIGKGKGKGQLSYPQGITLIGQRVFVSDCGDHPISVFNHENGKYIKSFGSAGEGPGQFNEPDGICAENGRLYIADARNHRIQIFSEEGVYINQLKTAANTYPRAVMIKDSQLFISESETNRISIWDIKSEKYVRSFGERGNGNGQFNFPMGLTMISQNEMLICDLNNHRIQTFE